MKRFLTFSSALFAACLMTTQLLGQCTADFDFGDATLGVSPNPELGEQFEPGVVGESYEDILHILLPQYAAEVDSTLGFPPPLRLTAFHFPLWSWWIWKTLVNHNPRSSWFGSNLQQQWRLWQPLLILGRQSILRVAHRNAECSWRVSRRYLRHGWISFLGFPSAKRWSSDHSFWTWVRRMHQ